MICSGKDSHNRDARDEHDDNRTNHRRELVHRQGGKCARCGGAMGDDVHVTHIRPVSAGAGPALVSAGNMVATHSDCSIEPDLQHTFYVPGCACATCVELKAQGDWDAQRSIEDVHCGRCDAKPGEPCVIPKAGPGSGLDYHADRLALQYLGDCPRCGAAVGWSCISDSGRVTRPHKARLEESP